THRDLAAEVQTQQFRQDLFYRLNVIEIVVPPLRERRGDLPALCAALLERIALESGMPVPVLSAEVVGQLCGLRLSGNVRELENLLHRAVALSDGACLHVDFAPTQAVGLQMVASGDPTPAPHESALPQDLQVYLDQLEREVLIRALYRYRYNRTAAAAALGLNLRQIRYRMARLNILSPRDDDGSI
ncbi:MAG: helix-turn-helix domain-containing protein, partial [Betaproteobacteria bacterium]